jgi:F-type H+-transporting ATPase subunit epsilon
MASTIRLDIVTPGKVVFSKDINVLVAPAIDGDIGILPKHTPLITALKTGVLEIKIDGQKLFISISKGFMEVKPEQINVVVKSAELPGEINVNRAQKALERAKKRLELKDDEIDFIRAEGALERAIARLKAAEYHNRV